MRLRLVGLTTTLIMLLATASLASAESIPAAPPELVDEALELVEATVEETEDDLQPEPSEDSAEEESERAQSEDKDQSEFRQDVETVEATVDQLLTELDLMGNLDAADESSTDDDAAEQEPDETVAPATQSEVAPRSIDYVTPTVIAAAALSIAAAASKTGLLRFLSPAALGLFSRFQGPKVLEHPRRAELIALVCKSPGITVPDLCHTTGLSRNAVLHHLRMLEDQDMIVHQRMGRSTHWYENGGRYGRDRKEAYAVLQDERTRDVARFIVDAPGTHQGAIGSALGLAPSVVHWHMKRLEDAALVQRTRQGRSMLCFPGGPLSELAL